MTLQIHEIHDLEDNQVADILSRGLSKIDKTSSYAKNYHPDYKDDPGNLFYVIENGRYRSGKGKYFVLEQNGEFISCAGWNEYDLDPNVALLLTRMYTDPMHRVNYYHATHILPKLLEETSHYKHQWVTMNLYNKKIYNWFLRKEEGKATGLYNTWPDIYRNFKPLGIKTIYYTEQYVAEYEK